MGEWGWLLFVAAVVCGLPIAGLSAVVYAVGMRRGRRGASGPDVDRLASDLAAARREHSQTLQGLVGQIAALQRAVASLAEAAGLPPPDLGSTATGGAPPGQASFWEVPATTAVPEPPSPGPTTVAPEPPGVGPTVLPEPAPPITTYWGVSRPPAAEVPSAPGATPAPAAAPVPAAVPGAAAPSGSPSPAPSTSGASGIPRPPAIPAAPPPPRPSADRGFESQIGTRLFVWVGAIAVALAGTLFVRYAFEHDLIGPELRVALGILFGVGLLGAGERLLGRMPRIPAALSAAGVAVLYASFLSAGRFYGLISMTAAFVLMALTTAVAVGLSLRQGQIVAVIGLVGGFLTPYLVGPTVDPHPLPLFTYLLVLQIGLIAVSRRQGWGNIAIVALIAGWLWVLVWMTGVPFEFGDGRWLGLFLVASTAAFVLSVLQSGGNDRWRDPYLAGVLIAGAFVGSTLLMAVLVGAEDFGILEWAYLALLGAGAIAVGRLRYPYIGLPWITASMTLVPLLQWGYDVLDPRSEYLWQFLLTLLVFTVLYGAGAYVAMRGAPRAWPWAGLAAASSAAFLLVGYYRTGNLLGDTHFWGITCLVLAVVYIAAAAPIARRRAAMSNASPPTPTSDPEVEPTAASVPLPAEPGRTEPGAGSPSPFGAMSRDGALSTYRGASEALAILAAGATFFLAFAVPVELEQEWITVAWAIEVAALVWIAGSLDVPALRRVAWPLVAMVAARLLVNPFVLDYPIGSYPVLNWLLYGYGLPMAAFGLAAHIAHIDEDRRLSVALQVLAAAFGVYLVGLQIHHYFHLTNFGTLSIVWLEWGALSSGWLVYAWLLFGSSRRWPWAAPALDGAGRVVALVGLAAALVGAGFVANPLWTHAAVGEMPILNRLLFVYGLPAVLAVAALRVADPRRFMHLEWREAMGAGAFLLVFLMVSLEVRQYFHGTYLNTGTLTLAERFGYSLAWALLGLVLLAIGVARANRPARYASLAVMMLTVAKVFLYDLSNLQDLYRVFSLLGLGASLLLLAYVYQRFVFKEAPE